MRIVVLCTKFFDEGGATIRLFGTCYIIIYVKKPQQPEGRRIFVK